MGNSNGGKVLKLLKSYVEKVVFKRVRIVTSDYTTKTKLCLL